jgi:hypothetical protein
MRGVAGHAEHDSHHRGEAEGEVTELSPTEVFHQRRVQHACRAGAEQHANRAAQHAEHDGSDQELHQDDSASRRALCECRSPASAR